MINTVDTTARLTNLSLEAFEGRAQEDIESRIAAGEEKAAAVTTGSLRAMHLASAQQHGAKASDIGHHLQFVQGEEEAAEQELAEESRADAPSPALKPDQSLLMELVLTG